MSQVGQPYLSYGYGGQDTHALPLVLLQHAVPSLLLALRFGWARHKYCLPRQLTYRWVRKVMIYRSSY